MNSIVKVHQLTKSYKTVTALNDVSFSLEEGKIYGLLGRNGAGKTTLIQILTSQIFATSGDLKLFGEHPYENDRVLSQVCFIKENQRYPDGFCLKDVLEVASMFFPQWNQEYASSLIDDFQLPLNRKMRVLSRGMLSSAGIVVGLASRTPLTIFDEPYLGLDAVARNIFYDRLIEDYTAHPRTILLSTHLIDEVSRLLEHIIVLDHGKLILDEDTETLRGKAVNVMGPASAVETFLENKTLLHRESLGEMVSATVLNHINPMDQNQSEGNGLKFMPVSLQEMVIHLTSGTSERKVASH
jgi:ABC-2 type transport system ATP-binding protein